MSAKAYADDFSAVATPEVLLEVISRLSNSIYGLNLSKQSSYGLTLRIRRQTCLNRLLALESKLSALERTSWVDLKKKGGRERTDYFSLICFGFYVFYI